VYEMMFRHMCSSFCLSLVGKPQKWLLKGLVAWKSLKLSHKVTIQTVTQSFHHTRMLFCFTYFSSLWLVCIASHLKQLQILVENKHSWYIYCNIGIHKKDIRKIVLVLRSSTYLFLIIHSFRSNPSEIKQ